MIKVCSELETHLGISDKTLAEFIINLGEDACDLGYEVFYNRLVDNSLEGDAVGEGGVLSHRVDKFQDGQVK